MGRKRKKILLENVHISDAGAKGKAITRLENGLVLFVEGAVPGDVCDVLVHKKRRSFLEGKPVKFHSFSERRREAKCEHFGLCGGCKWQFMGYEHQLEFKQKEVVNSLSRIGGIDLPQVNPIMGCENEFRYRNKMDFAFTNRRWITEEESSEGKEISNRNGAGFRVSGFWDKVINLNECHLQAEPSNAIRKAARDYAIENELDFFDIAEKEGFLRALTIRMSSSSEIMVLFQFFYEDETKNQTVKLRYQGVSHQPIIDTVWSPSSNPFSNTDPGLSTYISVSKVSGNGEDTYIKYNRKSAMRTFLSMFREKEFWSGALQIALGLYLGFVSLLVAVYLFGLVFDAVTR